MLKEFRTSRKMTQQRFANYIGVPRSTYESWESGRRKPSPEKQRHINMAIRRIKAYEVANSYYNALESYETKPRFTWKRKLLKLIVFILIVIILTVLY
jgi:transcriptional regulator with XRE-family HTH domain